MDYKKAKEYMINYMNINDQTMSVAPMSLYTRTVTVKEFFEIMESAFDKATK